MKIFNLGQYQCSLALKTIMQIIKCINVPNNKYQKGNIKGREETHINPISYGISDLRPSPQDVKLPLVELLR